MTAPQIAVPCANDDEGKAEEPPGCKVPESVGTVEYDEVHPDAPLGALIGAVDNAGPVTLCVTEIGRDRGNQPDQRGIDSIQVKLTGFQGVQTGRQVPHLVAVWTVSDCDVSHKGQVQQQ